ncbi:hypothetical protein DITRI_Ditri20bG0112000 [Diplodiscus trichospermus]
MYKTKQQETKDVVPSGSRKLVGCPHFPIQILITMAETTTSDCNFDPYKHLHITLNPDGSFYNYERTSANSDFSDDSVRVLSKDISINQSKNTWARIFLPKQALNNPTSAQKLPVFVYFHGGGFILYSPDEAMCHKFCSNMASELSIIIVLASYRLAPEHRLPAAYEDAMEALFWIKTSHDN